MRQLILTVLVGSLVTLVAVAPARGAAAEPVAAAEVLPVPAPAVPAGAAALFGFPQPLQASVVCVEATDYCYCYNACAYQTQACLAGCPALGQPGRFQCLSDCYDADWDCTSAC